MSIVHHERPERPEFLTEHSGCLMIKLKETEGML